MKTMLRVLPAVALAMIAASPAIAGGAWHHHPGTAQPAGSATPVPEPADAALFGLGIAGVAIGRRFRRKG